MMGGLDPGCPKVQQDEVVKILQSLKYIQRFDEEEPDELTQALRSMSYEQFINDPTGEKIRATLGKVDEDSAEVQFERRV